jgi:hypothetical protein
MVTRERTTGAVRAVHARSQSHDEHPRLWITKGSHRFAVVLGMFGAHSVQEGGEARATTTAGIENFTHAGSITMSALAFSAHKKRATRIAA